MGKKKYLIVAVQLAEYVVELEYVTCKIFYIAMLQNWCERERRAFCANEFVQAFCASILCKIYERERRAFCASILCTHFVQKGFSTQMTKIYSMNTPCRPQVWRLPIRVFGLWSYRITLITNENCFVLPPPS